jgi:3-hydroxyisobutyrate dehydrogenase
MSDVVAYLGLGRMGAPMAANLARAGVDVRAWNRTSASALVPVAAQGGATVVATLAEAVADADLVLMCLGDVPDVREVLFGEGGVVASAKAGALVVDLSTIGPIAAREFDEELREGDFTFVDAPVSGGDIGAQKGTLAVMAGGSDENFGRALPYLEIIGGAVTHCGPVGSGQSVKLCNQVLGALHMVALTEAMVVARTLGLDPDLVVKVCKSGAAGSWALENLAPRQNGEDFAAGFKIDHLLKDLRLLEEVNDDLEGEELPGVDVAVDQFELAAEAKDGAGAELGTQALRLAYDR